MYATNVCLIDGKSSYAARLRLERRVDGIYRDVVNERGPYTARLRLGRRVDGIYRDVVDGTGLGSTQHVYVREEEWTVFIEMSLLEACTACLRLGRRVVGYFST